MYIKPKKQYSLAEARRSLATVVRSVEKGTVVELTRRGKPVAVLVSCSEYLGLQRGPRDLWEAIRLFRRESDLKRLAIDEVYRDVRDRTPGRRMPV